MSSDATPLLSTQHVTSTTARHESLVQYRRRLLVLICIAIVAADFGSYLSYAPQIAIYESLICDDAQHAGYLELSLSGVNLRCKTPYVQGELALLTAWKDTFDQLPGILLAIPYGFMGDRIGRRPVLLLSLLGFALEELAIRSISWWHELVPLRAIWATPIFQIIGGGPQVATAIAYSMLTDVYAIDERASLFFLMSATMLLGEILATPISAVLMSWNAWYPSLAGVAIQLFGFVAATALPETRRNQSSAISELSQAHCEPVTTTRPPLIHQSQDHRRKRPWMKIWSAKTRENLTGISLVCIVGAFLLASFGRQALQLVLQYASRRFVWSLAHTSWLITLKGVVNLLALLIILPKLSLLLSKRMSPMMKDLRLIQGSGLVLALGALLMGVAGSPPPFITGVFFLALGWGFYAALRSLATALVSSAQIGILNTSIGLAQSIGVAAAGPILTAAFRGGMRLDGFWQGLPFMIAASVFFGAICLTFCIFLPQTDGVSQADEDVCSISS